MPLCPQPIKLAAVKFFMTHKTEGGHILMTKGHENTRIGSFKYW